MTIKEATQNAIGFAQETLGQARTQGIRLEEIESATENGQPVWHITLSMIGSPDEQLQLAVAAIVGPRREYKTFTVSKDTGEVTAMKIRELSNV